MIEMAMATIGRRMKKFAMGELPRAFPVGLVSGGVSGVFSAPVASACWMVVCSPRSRRNSLDAEQAKLVVGNRRHRELRWCRMSLLHRLHFESDLFDPSGETRLRADTDAFGDRSLVVDADIGRLIR